MMQGNPGADAEHSPGAKKMVALLPPFLLVLYNILFLFSHNLRELAIVNQNLLVRLALPVAVGWLGTLLLLGILYVLFRNLNIAGIVASIYVMMFFSFGHVQKVYINQVVKKLGWDIQHVIKGLKFGQYRLFFLMWVLLGIGLTLLVLFFFKNRKKALPAASFYLNVVASLLLLITLAGITYFSVKRAFQPAHTNQETETPPQAEAGLSSGKTLPDIFFIILDSYAAESTLAEFGYDNSDFLEFLRQKGFYVAGKSCSNYAHTTFSMAATLNMKYITYLKDQLGINSENVTIPITMIENNRVMRFLKSRGYRFVFMGTPGGPISRNRFADKEFVCFKGFLQDRFIRLLLETTMVEPFIRKYINRFDRDKLLCQLETLPGIRDQMEGGGPLFVLAHLFTNHEPFIFEADGRPVSNLKQKAASHKQLYINQLIYTNKRMKGILEKILSDAPTPPIIILQGDHGPLGIEPRSREKKYRISHRILNGIYLPGKNQQGLYDSISPINNFRLIFNLYFGTNYELLEDRHYFSRPPGYGPYRIVDVTDIVKYPEEIHQHQ